MENKKVATITITVEVDGKSYKVTTETLGTMLDGVNSCHASMLKLIEEKNNKVE